MRSVPGPRNRIASKPCAFNASARVLSAARRDPPGLHGVLGVEPHRRRDGVPEALHVRLAEHRSCPGRVRRWDDHPVDEPFDDEREVDLAQVPRLRLADERRVEPCEQVRVRISGELDDRRTDVPPASRPVEDVRRRDAELLSRADSIAALRMWRSAASACTRLAPARNAARATARAIGTCSTWWKRMSSWPSWTLAPTRTARSA
jgi:hypothetical protein